MRAIESTPNAKREYKITLTHSEIYHLVFWLADAREPKAASTARQQGIVNEFCEMLEDVTDAPWRRPRSM